MVRASLLPPLTPHPPRGDQGESELYVEIVLPSLTDSRGEACLPSPSSPHSLIAK